MLRNAIERGFIAQLSDVERLDFLKETLKDLEPHIKDIFINRNALNDHFHYRQLSFSTPHHKLKSLYFRMQVVAA